MPQLLHGGERWAWGPPLADVPTGQAPKLPSLRQPWLASALHLGELELKAPPVLVVCWGQGPYTEALAAVDQW